MEICRLLSFSAWVYHFMDLQRKVGQEDWHERHEIVHKHAVDAPANIVYHFHRLEATLGLVWA